MINSIPVYVMTANQTMKAVQAFAYLFNEFWSTKTQVTILGYDMPDFELPSNFNYISLGIQRGKNYWSDDIKAYFSNECNDELFILTFEDNLIIDKIDKPLLEYAIEFCTANKDGLLKFNLTADLQSRGNTVIESYDQFDLVQADQHEIFRLSLNTSIWNKEEFLNKLNPGESMHFFENPAKPNSTDDGLGVYGFGRSYVIKTSEAYRRGTKCENPYKDCLSNYTLSEDHVKVIEDNNWLPPIGSADYLQKLQTDQLQYIERK